MYRDYEGVPIGIEGYYPFHKVFDTLLFAHIECLSILFPDQFSPYCRGPTLGPYNEHRGSGPKCKAKWKKADFVHFLFNLSEPFAF